MTDSKETRVNYELYLKFISLVLTLANVSIGFWQYLDEQSFQYEIEFKRKMWQKQLDGYTEICKYSGLIANRPEVDFEENVNHFGSLYWGEMLLIEDTEVRDAMKDFYMAIHDYHPEDQDTHFRLKYKAKALADACRASSKESWLSNKLIEKE